MSITRTSSAIFRRQSYPRLVFTLALSINAAIAWSQATLIDSMATQIKPPVATPVAAMPTANALALRYDSAFSRYKPYRDEKATPWREANDTVTQIGGWRAYAKEAQQSEPATTDALPKMTATPTVLMPRGHGAHGGKQ